MRREHATGENWWVVLDNSGCVLALVTGCRKLKEALRIATSFFPDLEGGLSVRPWITATALQQNDSQQACHITPRVCERMEIAPPPNPLPEPLSVYTAVDRLRKRFCRPTVASAGGGR